METIFPTDPGYAAFFLVGFRKRADVPTITERVGTVILKRTYTIDPVAETVTPAATALPVRMQVEPDNHVANSDFEDEEGGAPLGWQADGSTMALAAGEGVADNALRVTGTARSRVVQTMVFAEPLGGRRFFFSVSAKADATPARIENVQLEAEGSAPICALDRDMGVGMVRFSASGTWPAGLEATKCDVVLRMATDGARTVFYDRVQVEERDHLTAWNPTSMVRYEEDIAPFKPQGDIIVLGFTAIGGTSRVRVDGTEWLERTVVGERQKALFGWEPRVDSPREAQMGEYRDNPDDYPAEWPVVTPVRDPLPGGPGDPRVLFNNLYFNAFRRDAAQLAAFPYLPPSAQIEIQRDVGSDLRFALRGDTAEATYFVYRGTGDDKESRWQSHSVPMNLDTLVIEPDANRCYALWRGVWPFDAHPEDAYRRLAVTASP